MYNMFHPCLFKDANSFVLETINMGHILTFKEIKETYLFCNHQLVELHHQHILLQETGL